MDGARDVVLVLHQNRKQTLLSLSRTAQAVQQHLAVGSARVQATSAPFLKLHGGPSMSSFCWDGVAADGRANWTAKEVHAAVTRRGRGDRGLANDRFHGSRRRRYPRTVRVGGVPTSRTVPSSAEEKATEYAAIRKEKAERHKHHKRRSRPMLAQARRLTLDFEAKFKREHGIRSRSRIFQDVELFVHYATARRKLVATSVAIKVGHLDAGNSAGLWVTAFLRPSRVLRDISRAKQHRLAVRRNGLLRGTGDGIGDLDVTLHWTRVNDMDKMAATALFGQSNKPAASGNQSCHALVRFAKANHRSPAEHDRPLCFRCNMPEVAGRCARKMVMEHPSDESRTKTSVQRVHHSECPTVALCSCTGAHVPIALSSVSGSNGAQPTTSIYGLQAGSIPVGTDTPKPVLPYAVSGLVRLYESDRRRAAGV